MWKPILTTHPAQPGSLTLNNLKALASAPSVEWSTVDDPVQGLYTIIDVQGT